MLNRKQIRIIKRAGRGASQPVSSHETANRIRAHREETARDAVTIVSEWVNDLRRKKAQEAAPRLHGLFGKAG